MSQSLQAGQIRSIEDTETQTSASQPTLKILIWTVVASLALISSGIFRTVRSDLYASDKNYLVDCPFPLSKIPHSIDGWHFLEGSETVLDPLTTRITGSTDHIIRTYVDDMTGVMLSVLVLFGPAEPVLPHTPQICYPSSGFSPVGATTDRDIKISDQATATFRTSVFAKAGGRSVIRQMVYHSFLLDGPWTPSVVGRKFPRKNPGIFKIQIQRRVTDNEKRDADEPIEDFLKKLLPVLDNMIRDSKQPIPAPIAHDSQGTAQPSPESNLVSSKQSR